MPTENEIQRSAAKTARAVQENVHSANSAPMWITPKYTTFVQSTLLPFQVKGSLLRAKPAPSG